ncbi:MAG: hypothetical protein WBG69_09305 [Arcobacteraceae bacterium]
MKKTMTDEEKEQKIDEMMANIKKEFSLANILVILTFIALCAAGLYASFSYRYDNDMKIINAFKKHKTLRCMNTIVSKKNGFKVIEKERSFSNGTVIYNAGACRELE